MDVLSFGSILSDILVKSNTVKKTTIKGKEYFYVKYGSKIDADKFEIAFGGSAHNVAYGITSLGRRSGIIGCVGNDEFGKSIVKSLEIAGVDTNGIQYSNKPTGKSVVIIGEDNERTILIHRGANDYIDQKKISKEYINLFKYFVFTSVVSDDSIKALDKSLKYALQSSLTVVANPSASMIVKRKKEFMEFLKRSRIAIMNEEEANILTRKKIPKSLEEIKELGPDTVVVTRGRNGCVAMHGKKLYEQKGFRVKVLDTTGAGDAFTAGFLNSIIRKDSIEYALKYATVCSALNVKSFGAVTNFPSENDIMKIIGDKNV
ncbi:MAG: carbohydrate kinase family protein [Candidatus Aenigmatarchaeota archaeon]|nr:carbohydrate kinase family protein [Candidatus Aenigmarchaeota archaeon]